MTSPLPGTGEDSAAERAARILLAERYITVGTADAAGPWTAPAQYRLLDGVALYIESDHRSRHATAITATGIASGAIFDSRAPAGDADGVQLLLRASEVPASPDDVRRVLAARIHPPIRPAALEAEVAAVLAVGAKRLYLLQIAELYVFDREAWRIAGTDARTEVDGARVFALVREALAER